MKFDNLAKAYAKRFCNENPLSEERIRTPVNFMTLDCGTHKCQVWNGESYFGPSEAWPAQLDDLAYWVQDSHAHEGINYSSLKSIIETEKPGILKRRYASREVYEDTLALLFTAVIEGIYCGKVDRIAERRLHEETKGMGSLKRRFTEKKKAREVVETGQLAKRIEAYNSGRGRHTMRVNPERTQNLARQRQIIYRTRELDI